MLRTIGSVTLALLAAPGFLAAEEVKGKVKSVNAEAHTLTLSVDSKDETFEVSKDVKVTYPHNRHHKHKKNDSTGDASNGLSGLKVGTAVSVTTSKEEEKEVVTAIKVEKQGKKTKKTST